MTKSEQLFSEAVNLMPGGVNSPVRAFRAVRKPIPGLLIGQEALTYGM